MKIGEGLQSRGPWLSFEPAWGTMASGVEQLWGSEAIQEVGERVRGGTAEVGLRLWAGDAQVRLAGDALRGGVTGQDTSSYRLGGQVKVGESMDLSLEGKRRENADGAIEHGIFFSWKFVL